MEVPNGWAVGMKVVADRVPTGVQHTEIAAVAFGNNHHAAAGVAAMSCVAPSVAARGDNRCGKSAR
jgi:hypothetical protein